MGTAELTRKRVDENQREIVQALNGIKGCEVLDLSAVGEGCPDIVVGYMGRNYFFELKNQDKPLGDKQLTQPQQKFFDNWTGQRQKVETIQEIIKTITGMG